ncbi:MAG TPA: hypothetical protein VFP37_18210 [Steroidobacteraceae bacterium]|nr:hypothetical protein [Steroidobacteraceae bacterium]
MKEIGKALLAALVAGAIAGIAGYAIGILIWSVEDPERHALGLTLILTFLAGTLTCGIAAARINRSKAFADAAIAAVCFEVVLLVVARPGLNPRVLVIAFLVAVFFALIGAFIGLPRGR